MGLCVSWNGENQSIFIVHWKIPNPQTWSHFSSRLLEMQVVVASLHNGLQCSPSPGVHSFPPIIGLICMTGEYCESDRVWLPKLGHKRCEFNLVLWDHLLWGQWAAMLWEHSISLRRSLLGEDLRPPTNSQHQLVIHVEVDFSAPEQHVAQPTSRPQPHERPWVRTTHLSHSLHEIRNAYCFKLLNFRVIYYAVKDN